MVKAFANPPQLLANTAAYEQAGRATSFEASCYTDVLGIEHLTGSLVEAVRYFGPRAGAQLRFVSKYDHIGPLLGLPHQGHTRARVSLNAELVVRRLEGGTASVEARVQALRKLALSVAQGGGSYPVGVVLPELRGEAEFVDVFCEEGAFPLDVARYYLEQARTWASG